MFYFNMICAAFNTRLIVENLPSACGSLRVALGAALPIALSIVAVDYDVLHSHQGASEVVAVALTRSMTSGPHDDGTVLTPELLFPTYRLTDIGKAGQPKLTVAQKAWCNTVLANAYWNHRKNRLWYSLQSTSYYPGRKLRPIIVFYVEKASLFDGAPDPHNAYYIVGGLGCAGFFTPFKPIGPVSVGPINTNNTWPAECYYDPLVPHQRVPSFVPPIPPTAPL